MIRRKSRNDGRFARNSTGARHESGTSFSGAARSAGPHGPKRRTLATIRYCDNCWKRSASRRPRYGRHRASVGKGLIASEHRRGRSNAECSERKRSSIVAKCSGAMIASISSRRHRASWCDMAWGPRSKPRGIQNMQHARAIEFGYELVKDPRATTH
jgi:hypothetical protein